MEIEFVRARGASDWVHVRRDDGTRVKWPWRKAGRQPPHDLMHHLVEGHLGLPGGFWELVAQGADFGFLAGEADRIARGGAPTGLDGRDSSGLVTAECVVAAVSTATWSRADDGQCLAWIREHCADRRVPVPATITADALARAREHIATTLAAWDGLTEGGALRVRIPIENPPAT
jgi:hypothetical protein